MRNFSSLLARKYPTDSPRQRQNRRLSFWQLLVDILQSGYVVKEINESKNNEKS